MLSKILEIKLPIIKIIFFISLFIITSNSILYFFEKYINGDRFLFDDLVLNYCAGVLYSQDVSPYGFGLGKTPLIDCVQNVIGSDWGMPAYFYSTFYLRILSKLNNFEFDTIRSIWLGLCFFSISLVLFFKDKDKDFTNFYIESFIYDIIKNKYYIYDSFIKDNLNIFIELFFYKNINRSKKISYKIKNYFYFKLSEIKKYNLDLETFFLEFEDKLLSE